MATFNKTAIYDLAKLLESERIMGTTPEQRQAAIHVLGHFDQGYYKAGGFTEKLIDAISHADRHNRAMLNQAFPELVEAVTLYQHVDGGLETLKEQARSAF